MNFKGIFLSEGSRILQLLCIGTPRDRANRWEFRAASGLQRGASAMASAALGQAETSSPTHSSARPRVPAVGIEIPERSLPFANCAMRLAKRSTNSAVSSPRPHGTAASCRMSKSTTRRSIGRCETGFLQGERIQNSRGTARRGRGTRKTTRQRQDPGRQPGLIVRGYISWLDGSVQPYGLVIPQSFSTDPWRKRRLDIWLHGRDNKLSELKFIQQHRTSTGQFGASGFVDDAIRMEVLQHFKFAGGGRAQALGHVKK